MKKVLPLFFILFSGSLFAQSSFEVYQSGTKIQSGTEITITTAERNNFGTEQQPIYVVSFESLIDFKNLTDQPINVTIQQTVLELPQSTPAGNGFSFCYSGTCEVVWRNMSKTETIPAKSSPDGFHLSYEPLMDEYGTASVQYEFYIGENNPEGSDYFVVTITYIYSENSITTSLNNNSIRDFNLYQFGNTVNLEFEFDYMAERSFTVYSITGERLGEYSLYEMSGTFQLPQILNKGLYIFTINENNKPLATRKMIIQ